MIQLLVSRGITGIENVEFYDAMIRGEDFMIEYYVGFSRGKIAVKIIGGENPREVLRKYYIHLRESRTQSC
ncbi:hypothetical protein [Archaeoglobus sp.]